MALTFCASFTGIENVQTCSLCSSHCLQAVSIRLKCHLVVKKFSPYVGSHGAPKIQLEELHTCFWVIYSHSSRTLPVCGKDTHSHRSPQRTLLCPIRTEIMIMANGK